MDTLNFIGFALAFILGIILGIIIMYVASLIIDRWIESRTPDEIEEIIKEEKGGNI